MHFSQPTLEFTTAFFKLVGESKKIAITSHKSPDEDSIASILSVYEILTQKYPDKDIKIFYESEPVNRLKIFKNYDRINFVSNIADSINGTDLLIMLDGSQFNRFSQQPERLATISNTICIDHHPSPIDNFTLSLVSPNHSSCTEIIYLTLCTDSPIDKDLAKIFLLGILGDTGNFSYLKPNQTETLLIAKKLLDISQIEIQEFQAEYRTLPVRIFKIVQELIKNTVFESIEDWPNFQYSFVTRKFKNKGEYSDNENSEANHVFTSSFIRRSEGYSWGFVITPKQDGSCGISSRSLPNSVNVRDLVERMGIGGGHDRAAAGSFKKVESEVNVEDSLNLVLKWLKENKPTID